MVTEAGGGERWPGRYGLDLGDGRPLVILPGFALRPWTYRRSARALAPDYRVIVPDIFEVGRGWDQPALVERLWELLDRVEISEPLVVGHSFGGGVALGLAARRPAAVRTLVFADSIALADGWRLAANALTGASLIRLATARPAIDFFRTIATRPAKVASAGWWAFSVDQTDAIAEMRASEVPVHVLWAERDTLVTRHDGARFAERIGAQFRIVTNPAGRGPVDHDWVYRHPALFAAVMAETDEGTLHTRALPGGDAGVGE